MTMTEDTDRFQRKMKALRAAMRATDQATVLARLVSIVLSMPAWLLSGAPYWAIPVFLVTIGWLCGRLYGGRVARQQERWLQEEFPELKL